MIIDFAAPNGNRIDTKQIEKIGKYQDLVREPRRL